MTLEQVFGEELRKVREEKGLSQEQLGFKSEYHRTYISQLERGQKSTSLKAVFRTSEVLGMNRSLSSGRHKFRNGSYCDLREMSVGGFVIDRLFVPKKRRGNGFHKKMLQELVHIADETNVPLAMAIAPDRKKGESFNSPRYNKVVDALLDSAKKLGFKPYCDGSDVYRLDLIYTPKEFAG